MSDPKDSPSSAEKPAIKVTDRRGVASEPAPEPVSVPPPAAPLRSPRPPVDFSTFVLSLASTALIQMGVAPHPETGKQEKEPELARETIDLLGLLREKTKGNLTDEETKFFDAVLYDLRVQFVESSRK
jgi:hypothetical protein